MNSARRKLPNRSRTNLGRASPKKFSSLKRDFAKEISDLFHRGNYADLVGRTVDAHPSNIPSGSEALVIGSLGNLGRVTEASHLFERLKGSLALNDLVAARFHLGVSYTRHSQYAEATQFFKSNLLDSRQSKDAIVQFYALMGLGFYRFFRSRFRRCIFEAEKALLSAMDAEFTYGKYLAFELLGHAKINIGLISEGFADIRKAEQFAASFGNGSMLEAFKIARCCYEAQFGLRTPDDLEQMIKDTPTQNTYSRATLFLELSRVLALAGRVSEAQQHLNQASRIIYENRHKRYTSTLSFRYAYHAYLSGRFEESLNLLRAAQSTLHGGIDQLLAVKILDLELKVRKQAGLSSGDDQAIEDRIVHLTWQAGSHIANRILSRRGGTTKSVPLFPGEDPTGDTLDDSNLGTLIDRSYFTAIRERLNLPFGKRLIALNAAADLSLLIDFADIRALFGLTKQLQSLLIAIGAGVQTKESLVAKVWGYKKYNPLRHDSILFQSVARLRQLLGPQREWVLNTDEGYCLKQDVGVFCLGALTEAEASRRQPADANEDKPLEDLRLETAKLRIGNNPFTARDYMSAMKVSKATACRDLGELVARRSLKKLGNAKLTRYRFA